MRILLIQENGRHFDNRLFRECFSWQRAFQEYDDIETVIWGLGHSNFNIIPNFNTFDCIICLEQYDRTGWVPHDIIANSKAKKYLWAVDSHSIGINHFRNIKSYGKYDHILCSIRHHVGDDDYWFPNAYDSFLITPQNVPKRAFIGFCGNGGSPERISFINNISKKEESFVFDEFIIGQNMVRSICSYDIHFNYNVLDDINYRNFETIGCGIPLLVNDNYQYGELGFKDGVNYISYNTMDEMFEKIHFYKNHKEQLSRIGQQGLELSKEHSYKHRIAALLRSIKK